MAADRSWRRDEGNALVAHFGEESAAHRAVAYRHVCCVPAAKICAHGSVSRWRLCLDVPARDVASPSALNWSFAWIPWWLLAMLCWAGTSGVRTLDVGRRCVCARGPRWCLGHRLVRHARRSTDYGGGAVVNVDTATPCRAARVYSALCVHNACVGWWCCCWARRCSIRWRCCQIPCALIATSHFSARRCGTVLDASSACFFFCRAALGRLPISAGFRCWLQACGWCAHHRAKM